MESIQNQVAIVTGGCSGIGFAVATAFADEGAQVAILDHDAKGIEQARSELGDQATFHQTDIASESSVQEAVAAVISKHGQIDIVVNAAGITGKTGAPIVDIELADFRKVYEVNLQGSFLIAKTVLPYMVERNYGRVLLVASIAGKEGNAGMASYSATKAGVIGLAKSIGKEYAETGVTINSLAPAVVKTPIHDTIPEEQIDYMTSKIPMQRCGTLPEIVAAIRFIVSPENSFTTGFCYDLSGGRATY